MTSDAASMVYVDGRLYSTEDLYSCQGQYCGYLTPWLLSLGDNSLCGECAEEAQLEVLHLQQLSSDLR